MSIALKLLTPPTTEPVSLSDAKAHLRVDGSDEDTLISMYIKAGREWCERYTGRVFMTQTWKMFLDHWPYSPNPEAPYWEGTREGAIDELFSSKRYIEIPRGPLISVTHLKAYDTSNSATTMDSSGYYVDTVSTPGRIVLNSGAAWPGVTLRPAQGVEIQFVAGYGAVETDVPQGIRMAVMLMAAHFYENREPVAIGTISKELENMVKPLLAPYVVVRL